MQIDAVFKPKVCPLIIVASSVAMVDLFVDILTDRHFAKS